MFELFRVAVEVTRQYGLRCIDEESLTVRDTQEANINLLKDFTVDVKSSDRFFNLQTTRELLEVYRSVADNPFIEQHILNGASFLILMLGQSAYDKLCEHMAASMAIGFSIPNDPKTVDSRSFDAILKTNPWLTFCLLTRFAWFSEPKPQQGS